MADSKGEATPKGKGEPQSQPQSEPAQQPKTPAEQRGEFNTSPDRVDPYSSQSEAEADMQYRADQAKYERSIKGAELPPSYEMQQEIEAERAADAKKAQEEAQQPDSYQQALESGTVGQPATNQPTTSSSSAQTDR